MAQTYMGMINLQDILGWATPLATAFKSMLEWEAANGIPGSPNKSLGYIATSSAKNSRILSLAI